MAVIKSSALGQARKSIGATNYYRRAGVQLARSKPTFAPGRVFSGAQLVAQKNMSLVQTMLLTYAGKMVAPYSNCSIKRIYSASSRYNRLVGGILKKVSADNLSAATDVEDFWFDDGVKHLGNWSTGNTVLQVKVKAMQLDGKAQVAGLSAGEKVVTTGVRHLTDGQRVEPIEATSATNIGGML